MWGTNRQKFLIGYFHPRRKQQACLASIWRYGSHVSNSRYQFFSEYAHQLFPLNNQAKHSFIPNHLTHISRQRFDLILPPELTENVKATQSVVLLLFLKQGHTIKKKQWQCVKWGLTQTRSVTCMRNIHSHVERALLKVKCFIQKFYSLLLVKIFVSCCKMRAPTSQ